MRDHRSPPAGALRLALAALLCGAQASARAAETAPAQAPAPAQGPVLHLKDGGFVAGTLADSGKPGRIRWQGSAFTAPFDFDAAAVSAVHAPAPAPAPAAVPKPEGEYSFTLAGGDVLFGALAGLDKSEAVLDVPHVGRLHVRRSALRRLDRLRGNADLVYVGPAGLTGWKQAATGGDPDWRNDTSWRDDAGDLVTDVAGAAVRGDFGIPALAAVEFEVSWGAKPDFALALGVGGEPESARRAVRFEVWEDDLVVCRETARDAVAASVAKLTPGEPGRVRLRAYLEQKKGRVVVVSEGGETLADLSVSDPEPGALPGVFLENKAGEVRLERLRVSRWNGTLPRPARADGANLVRVDGSATPGRVTGYDADANAFVVTDGSDETRVPADQVDGVSLSPLDGARRGGVRVVLQDGTRLTGELEKVERGKLWLSAAGVTEPAPLPAASLRSLVVLKGAPAAAAPPKPSGRLVLEGVRLAGSLADGRAGPGESCLAWLPEGSAAASPLRPGATGRVLYKEPPTPPPKPSPRTQMEIQIQARNQMIMRQQGVQARQGLGWPGFVRGFAGAEAGGSAAGKRSLHLRTGDVIPSEVTGIDENGVTFKSPLSDSTFVAHDKIKAVELAPAAPASARLNKPKRERLLTLPRAQKASPPTHMVRSRNGDYLRGRVLGMDAKTLRVEVRLEEKGVPRDRVARIIWLHPEAADAAKPTAGGAAPPAGPAPTPAPATAPATPRPGGETRVQAVLNDGVRLTFTADRDEGGTLSGKSDVLGACRVRLADLDHLLIGAAIEQEAARLAYQQWTLQNAPEPKDAQADGGPSADGRAPGTESAMVGKPAPDFALDLLDGSKFRLSEAKGAVVVLDFWATWCGPCLQAMPQVDRVAREFKDRGVRLVAVNLQESPKEITAMLERHKMSLTVALDRDGVVANKYAATAIPQTVIVGPDGKVERLFIGGGPRLGDQLREAILPLLPEAGRKEK